MGSPLVSSSSCMLDKSMSLDLLFAASCQWADRVSPPLFSWPLLVTATRLFGWVEMSKLNYFTVSRSWRPGEI